jgi:tetratricopeptide (TPR) repeat protein
MARWTEFAPKGSFDFDRKSVKKHWLRLHARDQEALPSDPDLLDAWAFFHNGHFHEARSLGLAVGDTGMTVANKATCVYARQMEPNEAKRLAMYQWVSERAALQTEREPGNPNAHFLLAYSLGRYSQGISVVKALAQGMGSRIKTALETTIALQPLHADAHFALGAFHAEIIDKVGALIGGMAYGVRRDASLQMFEQGFRLQPHSAVGLVEYATALMMLEGDDRHEEATSLYDHAAQLTPMDAQEYLDLARAKAGLSR